MSKTDPSWIGRPVVDAHCHVDLYPSPIEVVAEAENSCIYTIAVTNAPSVFFHTRALVNGKRFIRAAAGLHPELIHSHGHELDQLWPLLDETRYVGEIGLDYVSADPEHRRAQRRAFEEILRRCAAYGDKILTVHSRRSSADVISAFGSRFPGAVILHWFSGPLRDLQKAIDAGMYFSVNPAMVRSVSGRKLVARMPHDRVITETDGPFVTSRGHTATPPDTAEVIVHLGRLWRCTPEEAGDAITQNFVRIVGTF